MAKLTRNQVAALRHILAAAERAEKYIMHESTTVSRPFGGQQVPVEKAYGSDLCSLPAATTHLAQFIVNNS